MIVTPFFDPLYLLFVAPALILSVVASLLLHYWNNKYSNTLNSRGINGLDTAKTIATAYGLEVNYTTTNDDLGDHFDSTTNTVALSSRVATLSSIASVAIAAHEFGHVQQYASKSPIIVIRSIVVPVVGIGSNIGYFLIFAGIIIGISGLAWIGIALFSLSTFFTLLTLPVEFDASRRAMNFIKEQNLLLPSEISGAKKVLVAAALTYVAAAVGSILNLLYFVLQVRNNDNN